MVYVGNQGKRVVDRCGYWVLGRTIWDNVELVVGLLNMFSSVAMNGELRLRLGWGDECRFSLCDTFWYC